MSAKLQNSYDSIAAAAAAIGCTKRELRRAKKEGAPGFRGSRVYPAELVPWLKEKERQATLTPVPDATNGVVKGTPHELDKEGWEVRRMRLQCEQVELALEEKRGLLFDANNVKTSWLFHMCQASRELDGIAPDLAPRIAGRSSVDCEQMIREAIEAAKAKLRGNPYGEGPAECPACKARLDLIFAEAAAPIRVESVAKGKKPASTRKPRARQASKKKGRK